MNLCEIPKLDCSNRPCRSLLTAPGRSGDSFGEEPCLLPPSGREVQEGIVKLEKERFEGTHRRRARRTNERQIQ